MSRTTKTISVEDGLHLIGAKFSNRGAVQAEVLIRVGEVQVKRYAVRRRVGDGHTVYRWGRLVSAEVSYFDDDPELKWPHVVFIPARFDHSQYAKT